MSWLDIVLIIILAVSVFSGLKNGIIKAVLSLAGIIVGVILAGRYYVALAGQLAFIPQESLAKIAAFAIILVVVMAIAVVLASLLKWAASAIMLGWIDRLGGAVFGLVMGGIFCGALLAIWVKFLGIADVVTESAIAAILLDYFPIVLTLLPGEFDTVRSFFQ